MYEFGNMEELELGHNRPILELPAGTDSLYIKAIWSSS
jgi:hypothetical protein